MADPAPPGTDPEVAAVARHAAAAFPPAEAVERDGWLLRATPGLARGRLNSALPLAADPPLTTVLDFYAERGMTAQVQLQSTNPALGRELDARGWGARWPTAVLVRGTAEAAAGAGLEFLADPTPRWLEAWTRAEGRDAADVERHRAHVLIRLPRPAVFALSADGAAAGLAVAHGGGLAGVFSVAVDPARRRAGHATHLMDGLLAWARERGARSAYLEVERRNAPAHALYRRLGFTEAYGYVHRVAPPGGPTDQDRAATPDGSH